MKIVGKYFCLDNAMDGFKNNFEMKVLSENQSMGRIEITDL